MNCYTNDINYFSSLEMLVNGYESEYPFYEKNVTKLDDEIYEIRIDTGNLFAGDKIQSFNIRTYDISKVILTIDGIAVYSENFKMDWEVDIIPFTEGIRTFSCKKSEIILYIKSSSKPSVKTIYSLLNENQKSEYYESIGELYYKNDYAIFNLPNVVSR